MNEQPEYLTATEVAERWRISDREVRRMAERGELRAFKVGSLYRFARKGIESYEKANTR